MCGIVGLFLKNKALEPELGRMMSGMLATMCDRGPDSAGFAVYGAGDSCHVKLTVRATSPNFDFASLAGRLSEAVGSSVAVDVRESHGIFTVPEDAEQTARKTIEAIGDDVRMVGSGTRMEIYKEVGRPEAVANNVPLTVAHGNTPPTSVELSVLPLMVVDWARTADTPPPVAIASPTIR